MSSDKLLVSSLIAGAVGVPANTSNTTSTQQPSQQSSTLGAGGSLTSSSSSIPQPTPTTTAGGRLHCLDKELPRGKQEVSLSAFAFLFSEIVQYNQSKATHVSEFQQRMADVGYGVGIRMLELNCYVRGSAKRELSIIDMLGLISGPIWKRLFGKKADRVEQTVESGEFIITDDAILVNQFISTSKDTSGLNCASFVAGIVQGIIDASEFGGKVTAHVLHSDVPQAKGASKTGIFIKFNQDVLDRNSRL